MAQGVKDVESAELEGGVVDLGGVEIVEERGGGFLTGAGILAPGSFDEPVFVTGMFPSRDVSFGNWERQFWLSRLPELRDDCSVGKAILNTMVYLVADDFGQACDISSAAGVRFRFARVFRFGNWLGFGCGCHIGCFKKSFRRLPQASVGYRNRLEMGFRKVRTGPDF
jgi:hypothetical protein